MNPHNKIKPTPSQLREWYESSRSIYLTEKNGRKHQGKIRIYKPIVNDALIWMGNSPIAFHQKNIITYRIEPILKKLEASIALVKNVCIFGSDNKISDIERTNGWISNQKYRYHSPGKYMKLSKSKFILKNDGIANAVFDQENRGLYARVKDWYYRVDDIKKTNNHHCHETISKKTTLDPLKDPKFKLNSAITETLCTALMAIENRFGNCWSKSALVAKYLWENSDGIFRIEIVSMATFDHVLVIVNRSGDLHNPSSWGNAWIIDAWYKDGIIFPAKEYLKKIKEIKTYAALQTKKLEEISLHGRSCSNNDASLIDQVLCDIKPASNLYPTYAKNMRFEDYYTHQRVNENLWNRLFKNDKAKHQKSFKDCLDNIKQFNKKRKLNLDDEISCDVEENFNEKPRPHKSMCVRIFGR